MLIFSVLFLFVVFFIGSALGVNLMTGGIVVVSSVDMCILVLNVSMLIVVRDWWCP